MVNSTKANADLLVHLHLDILNRHELTWSIDIMMSQYAAPEPGLLSVGHSC